MQIGQDDSWVYALSLYVLRLYLYQSFGSTPIDDACMTPFGAGGQDFIGCISIRVVPDDEFIAIYVVGEQHVLSAYPYAVFRINGQRRNTVEQSGVYGMKLFGIQIVISETSVGSYPYPLLFIQCCSCNSFFSVGVKT